MLYRIALVRGLDMDQAPDDTQYDFAVVSALPDRAGRGGYAGRIVAFGGTVCSSMCGKGRLELLAGFEIDARIVTPDYGLSAKEFESIIGRKHTTTTVRYPLAFSKSIPENYHDAVLNYQESSLTVILFFECFSGI